MEILLDEAVEIIFQPHVVDYIIHYVMKAYVI